MFVSAGVQTREHFQREVFEELWRGRTPCVDDCEASAGIERRFLAYRGTDQVFGLSHPGSPTFAHE